MKRIILFLIIIFSLPAFADTEIRDTEIENKIFEIIKPLTKTTHKIHIISDYDFNASASSTGISINTGLLTKIDNWAELQAVLAHELGHVELGHLAQMSARMNMETNRSLAIQMLGIGLLAINPEAAIGVIAGSSGLAMQSMLAFGRDEERAADDYAVKLLTKSDIDPNALITVFQKMQNVNAEHKVNPNNINHPLTDERIKNIKLQIKTKFKKNNDDGLKLIQAKLIGYLDSDDRIQTLYPNKDTGSPALYARAIANMRGGNLETAKTFALQLIGKNKDSPYFYELLGDIEFQFGHFDDSVKAYQKSISLLKENKTQIELALALVLSERNKPGDFADATELSKKSLLKEKLPLAYWVLAKTDAKFSDYYMAEYYYLMRDISKVKDFANRAIKTLTKDSAEYMKAMDILKQ